MSDITTLPLSNSLIAASLNERNPFEKVYDISGGYNKMTRFIESLNPSGPKNFASDKYEKAVLGNLNVATEIGVASTLVGTNLEVTFLDAGYNNFRVGDIVQDSDGNQGRVSVLGTGTVQLQSINTTLTTSMFTAGTTIRRIADASASDFSVGKTPLYYIPETDYNYSQIIRNSTSLSRRQMTLSTYVRWNGDYWWLAQDELAVKDLSRQVEYNTIFSQRARINTPQGSVDMNGGLLWSIDNRGGTHIVSPTELDETLFQDLIATMARKNASRSRKITLFYGLQCMVAMQRFLSNNWLKYVGVNNTFGGKEVKGLNIMTYSYIGVEIDFVPLPLLDDPTMFPEISSITGAPRMSSSFFMLDTTPIDAADSGTLPAIETIYKGNKEIIYNYIPGMVGMNGGDPSGFSKDGKYLTASSVDGIQCEYLTDRGINIVDAKNMLYFELAS